MRTVVAYPGLMSHAQQSARALWEAGCLATFVTTFVHQPDGALGRFLAHLPGALPQRVARQLARRQASEVPADFVRADATWEILRVAAGRAGLGEIVVDRIWDQMSHAFDARVAARDVPHAAAVMAFEYTARAAFEAARMRGAARILQVPSLDSRHSEEVRRREAARWPDLVRPEAAYFAARFARRYARRQAEIAAADLVVANSALTARTHVEAGADPARVVAVPLAAPPAREAAALREPATDRPLAVLWAGSFSVMKGAPYLLEAWRRLGAGAAARLDVYGRIDLPTDGVAALAGSLDHIAFHGSVPQPRLFAAYGGADVLVAPTLSDGFGMVVLEAMAHGLPVIVTDAAGVAASVTPGSGLVIPAADVDALAQALRWCLDERRRLAAMHHGALEVARTRQWPDYRRDLIAALDAGLRRAGYAPSFGPMP